MFLLKRRRCHKKYDDRLVVDRAAIEAPFIRPYGLLIDLPARMIIDFEKQNKSPISWNPQTQMIISFREAFVGCKFAVKK